MPTSDHYLTLAREIRSALDREKLAFKSYSRAKITERLREISGEPNTRIKTAAMAPEIERILVEQGIRTFPKISETTTGENIRVWRAGTIAAQLLDFILNPGERTDRELGNLTQKMKGRWDWTSPLDADDQGGSRIGEGL